MVLAMGLHVGLLALEANYLKEEREAEDLAEDGFKFEVGHFLHASQRHWGGRVAKDPWVTESAKSLVAGEGVEVGELEAEVLGKGG